MRQKLIVSSYQDEGVLGGVSGSGLLAASKSAIAARPFRSVRGLMGKIPEVPSNRATNLKM